MTHGMWPARHWIRVWMSATGGGNGWLWYAMGLPILLFGGERRFVALGAASLASETGIAMFLHSKRAAARSRPRELEPHCWAALLPPDHFSFPLGHSIAFAVALSIGRFNPELASGPLIGALGVAIPRILLKMHFLPDMLIGADRGYGTVELIKVM